MHGYADLPSLRAGDNNLTILEDALERGRQLGIADDLVDTDHRPHRGGQADLAEPHHRPRATPAIRLQHDRADHILDRAVGEDIDLGVVHPLRLAPLFTHRLDAGGDLAGQRVLAGAGRTIETEGHTRAL